MMESRLKKFVCDKGLLVFCQRKNIIWALIACEWIDEKKKKKKRTDCDYSWWRQVSVSSLASDTNFHRGQNDSQRLRLAADRLWLRLLRLYEFCFRVTGIMTRFDYFSRIFCPTKRRHFASCNHCPHIFQPALFWHRWPWLFFDCLWSFIVRFNFHKKFQI